MHIRGNIYQRIFETFSLPNNREWKTEGRKVEKEKSVKKRCEAQK